MKAEVMDVLLYIFERFQDDEFVPVEEAQALVSELEEVGFETSQIDSALNWINGLVENSSDEFVPSGSNQQNVRIYHVKEQKALSIECRSFLYSLEKKGILDVHSREAVIDRVMALGSSQPISLDELKWVVMMVFFNLPGKEDAAMWLENIDNHFH